MSSSSALWSSLSTNYIQQVKETRDTFLKEISKKQEDFAQMMKKNQETIIEEAVARRIFKLETENDKSHLPEVLCSRGVGVQKTFPSVKLPNTSVPKEVSTVKTEEAKLDKSISSRLSPTAPEFVLPKRSNPPESVSPHLPNQFYNNQVLIQQLPDVGINPNMEKLRIDPGNINQIRVAVLPHGLQRHPIQGGHVPGFPGAHVLGYSGAQMARYPDPQVVRCPGLAQPLFLNTRLI